MKKPFILLLALSLGSCATQKAKIVDEVPAETADKKEDSSVQKTSPPAPVIPSPADDGMRLGDDILTLPDESQLRATTRDGDGKADAPVIARPPRE